MDATKLAKEILANVGGKENVQDLTHCFTRLRFVLKDNSKADKKTVERLEGVIQVVEAGGQFQVVLGSKVEKVYDATLPLVDLDEGGSSTPQSGNFWNNTLQLVSKMFTPLIPAIAASGLISGILTAARLLFKQQGIDITTNDTYVLLYAASQIIFYFMPVFLGYTAAKALKCNEIIAMTIGGFLCYPQVDALIQKTDVATNMFGLPVIKGAWTIGESTKAFSYTGSVIPILLAVLVLFYVEKLLKKYIPQVLQIILVPGLALMIMLPLTLSVLGPVGVWVGNVIQIVYTSMMSFNAILGGAIIGGLWGVFVIFGAHRALLPIGLNDVAVSGQQNLLAFAGAANFSQGGAALGVMLKTNNKDLKSVSIAATISAAVVGITEPAIYGVNLRLKKPMLAAIICGALGGGIMGFGGVYGDAFANNGVLTIFTYAAGGMDKFLYYIVGCLVAFFGSAALTYVLGFEDVEEVTSVSKVKEIPENFDLGSPVIGEAIPLKEVADEVFSSEALGKGIAVKPTVGEILAPDNCTVTFVYPTKHAIGLTLDNGIELLLHIGINTVELDGKYFTQLVEAGTHVPKGAKIMSFDIEQIKKDGYDPTVMIIVGNTADYKVVEGFSQENATVNTPVVSIQR